MEGKEFCGIDIMFDGVRYHINGNKEEVHDMLESISSSYYGEQEEVGIIFRYY